MILFFSDLHLGIRSYSTLNSNGLYTAEEDSRMALNELLERAKQPDIQMVICGGDVFHTNNPTSENIKFFIEWLHKMNELKKPFWLIPGNHDCSTYSNSLTFISELKLSSINLIDKKMIEVFDRINFKIEGYTIKFVPYIPNLSNKNKDLITDSNFIAAINEAEDNTIIISHIQEQSCQVGSEGRMISRGVEVLDAATILNRNITLLLGHIHRAQVYKKGSVTVVYSGSTTYMDAGDLGMIKSYVIFTKEGEVKFEPFTTIRRFIKYVIPKDEDPILYLEKQRIPNNAVVFVEYSYANMDRTELHKFFKNKQCMVGNIIQVKEREEVKLVTAKIVDKNPYNIFTSYLQSYKDKVTINGDLIESVEKIGKLKIEALLGAK